MFMCMHIRAFHALELLILITRIQAEKRGLTAGKIGLTPPPPAPRPYIRKLLTRTVKTNCNEHA